MKFMQKEYFCGMELIDTHTHLADEAFAGEEDAAVERAVAAGVKQMLLPDTGPGDRAGIFSLAARHPGILHPMVGLYPGHVGENWKDDVDSFSSWLDKGAVAVGEIGLDYHYTKENAQLQKEAFKAQLEIARDRGLPVNIHLRDAVEDFFAVMEECRGMKLRGNLHAFSGSAELFGRMSRYGEWYAGIGGVVTFKNARIAAELLNIPAERLLLETDAPYLTPVPFRGTRNESAYIPLIAEKIADIKGVPAERIADITTANAKRLFSI